MSPRYPFNGRLGGPRGRSRNFERKKNRVQDIKPLFFGYPARNFATIAITPEIPI
jgi:hypothetical protein